MTLSAVAKRYANALADVVGAPASALKPDAALAELRAFEAAVRESPELAAALETPAIAGSRKKAVIGKIAERLQLSTVTRNFLFVLIDHRRTGSLSGIMHAFEAVLDERSGVVPAEIVSAGEMLEADRTALAAQLEKLTGKRVRLTFKIDPSLIGGVVTKVGATVYDGSVRGSLESLERRLSAEPVAAAAGESK
jgi:F-type H+-transporting ATPase subunit delta